jgi:hypothetical protein
MSLLEDIRVADDLTKDWRHTNDLKRATRYLEAEVRRLGQSLASREPRGFSGEIVELLVSDPTLDDILKCRPRLGGEWIDADVFCAKPFRLRRSPFDGNTIAVDGRVFGGNVAGVLIPAGTDYKLAGKTLQLPGDETIEGVYYLYSDALHRHADNGSETEAEVIVPPWTPNFDMIYADRITFNLDLLDPIGKAITLLARTDARAWSAVLV